MQLTRLEIKGFKSFGDKITINFNEGVTAIVGPNGCGKSNVVDAIRWVLGEQSTRMLRSEKMENVIFNGTKSRKPGNLAEVSLSFDNTRNVLPTEFSSVTITRKLYRTGESEYRLNDVQCRLKDITDLFLDTGIGADSYSIIELKMVDEIIANKEGSRRNLFEEASGISKYKLRKKQTFSRLKDTEADLARVEDLLFEIEKNLKTLENQAKKTERFYKLKEQYKALSVMLATFRIAGFKTALEKIEDEQQKHSVERSGLQAEVDKLEALLQQQKLDSLTLEKNLSLQQKATNEFTGRIRQYESEKKLKNEQLRFQQEKESRLQDELEKDKNQLNHVLYNQKRLGEEKSQEEKVLGEVESDLESLKSSLDFLRNEQQQARKKLDESTKRDNDLQNELYRTEKNSDMLRIQRETLQQESQRNLDDTTSREAELSEFGKAIATLKEKTGEQSEILRQLQQTEEENALKLTESEQKLQAGREELALKNRQLDAKQNEYNLTKSLVDNLEGFPESIRFLKKNAGWAKQAPLFSDILFCDEKYRIAIENFLEPVMNHYVVEDESEAVKAVQLLKDAGKGRAQFFLVKKALEHEKKKGEKPSSGNPVAAMDVIEVEARYRPLCEILLGHVFLVDDQQDEAIRDMQTGDTVLLGKSGRFSKTQITLAGGSVGLFEGKRIGRQKNLENLAKSIRTLETEIGRHNEQVGIFQGEIGTLKAATKRTEIQQQQQALNRLESELISLNTRQEQYQAFLSNSRDRKEDISRRMQAIDEEQAGIRPKLDQLKTDRETHQHTLAQERTAFNELSERVNAQSAQFNQQNIRFHQQQNKLNGLLKDLEYREAQHRNLMQRIGQNDAELLKTREAMKETLQHVDHSDDDLLAMYTQKEEMETGLKQAEEHHYGARENINKTETEISGVRRKKEAFDGLELDLRERKNNLKLELNSLKERLSAEFNTDIEEVLEAETPAGHTEEELLEKTARMRRQIEDFGPVNPMAMEAYNEMNERYTFIQDQKKDLLEAKTSLMQTIKEIDDTAKEQFMNAFIQVRENFIQVFRSLFNEEDSCDLLLTDPNNPLESDIEILAKPKGKRPQSINQLSGGEKTLTATAILFSLYLLKPAPFCIFDEVDAPLDDTNIDKFNAIIRKFSNRSQFIVVSHNKRTIASTDVIYGVTMVEQGISRVVAVDMREMAGS
ncbi:MAG: chromosome segregation protein SMC [Mucilaginibacter polytrichastri]|nr:chromosome segregation protein SMC [Mucilaginibacter polytrichastri]